MPTATAIPGTKDRPLARRRRFERAKAGVALVIVFLLMYAGLRGRQHARLQAKLDDITLICDQLQQKLDDEPRSTGSPAPLSKPEVAALAAALKRRLAQFDSDYRPEKWAHSESWEVRLSKATLANAEQRFAEALAIITDQDEQGTGARTEAQTGRLVRVLQIRGDSLYGLRQWPDALERYRQVLKLKPDPIPTIARLADCYLALGKSNEASIAYYQLAKAYDHRGSDLLVQGKPNAAIRHYDQAIEIQTRLAEQDGERGQAVELAKNHNHRGDAFLLQGQIKTAIDDYDQAIRILSRLVEQENRGELADELASSRQTRGRALLAQGQLGTAIGEFEIAIKTLARLVEQEGRTELASKLATSYHHLGNAFLAEGKTEAAIASFDNAVTIFTRLVERGRIDLAYDLARSLNNRGAARRAQQKPDAATADFDNAIKLLGRLVEKEASSELAHNPAKSHPNRELVRRGEVRLDVAMAYSETVLEALLRTRLGNQGERRELAALLAVTLKNRAYARLVEGKPDAAIGDFKEAIEIHAELVERAAQADLIPQFARSLSSLAWLYATHPEERFRNGRSAKEYALKACELSQWQDSIPLEALAAACAETGSFVDAIRWQEKAAALAPTKAKPQAGSRLELYKSGKPYRAPLSKTG